MIAMAHQPFMYITGFYILGIILNCLLTAGRVHTFGPLHFFLLTFILCILNIRFFNKTYVSTVLLLLALTSLGAGYTHSRQYSDQDHIVHIAKYYRKKPVAVKGIIVSAVEKRKAIQGVKTTFTLDVCEVQAQWGWEKKTGKILVNVFRDFNGEYGDYLQLEGKLHRPYNFSPERNFSYRNYLHNRGVYLLLSVKKDADIQVLGKEQGNALRSLSLKIRGNLISILTQHLSRNEAGIMGEILLGDRSAIAKHVRTLFVQTGTAHVLAISGLNIGAVAALFLLFAKFIPVGRKVQLGGVILFLIGYAFLTGGYPSVVRATIMMVVFLAGFIIEKEQNTFNALFLAAMLILVFNPLNLFDVGFQLSFICVFAIIYLHGWLQKKKFFSFLGLKSQPGVNRWGQLIAQSLFISLAAWIGSAGLVVYYFGIITPITIFANFFIVPLIAVAVALGFGLLAAGIALPVCAPMFAACLKVVLNGMVAIIFLCSKIPFAYLYLSDVRIWHIMVYYIILSVVIFSPWKRLSDSFQAMFFKTFH